MNSLICIIVKEKYLKQKVIPIKTNRFYIQYEFKKYVESK